MSQVKNLGNAVRDSEFHRASLQFAISSLQSKISKELHLPSVFYSSITRDTILNMVEAFVSEEDLGLSTDEKKLVVNSLIATLPLKGVEAFLLYKIVTELHPTLESDSPAMRDAIVDIIETSLIQEGILLSAEDRKRVINGIMAELFGLGLLDQLLSDESISTIMINGPYSIYVERNGYVSRANAQFNDAKHVMRIIERILSPFNLTIDAEHPYRQARLRDGSMVTIMIPPLVLNGPSLAIHKFPHWSIQMEDLIRFGNLSPEVAEFLAVCVIAKLNILICGDTGVDKSILVNVLSNFIHDRRTISLERVAELQLQGENVITLEEISPIFAPGEAVEFLFKSLPDRLIFGSLTEATIYPYLLCSLKIGTLATLVAPNTKRALRQLELGLASAVPSLSAEMIRDSITEAIDLVVVLSRVRDGSSKVTEIVEVTSQENGAYRLQKLFEFEETDIESGKVVGRFRATGVKPTFMRRIQQAGFEGHL